MIPVRLKIKGQVTMGNLDKKNISIEVSKECWKRLKILSIQKDISLPELVKDILEKFPRKTQEEV